VPDVWFAIPGDLETLTGGYIYARRLIDSLPATGWHPRILSLPNTYPAPSDEDLSVTREIFESIPKNSIVLVDGLAFGAMPQALLDGLDLSFVALVHHPLALETGLTDAEANRLRTAETAALRTARAIIVTGPDTARTLSSDYGVPGEKVFVAVPGTNPAARAQGSGATPQLLTVATLTHRKGYDVLVRALALVADLPWNSVCIGSLTRDQDTTASIRAMIKSSKLDKRIELLGEIPADKLNDVYMQSDVFVLPSRHEGYGMAFAEALAQGLPIVACGVGAVPDTVPTEAGKLVPSDDPDALSAAIRKLLTDDPAREAMANAAWTHGQSLPRWSNTAEAVATALAAAL
jgi:glycosyltransferase involved in cell wall biosynthesis